MRELSGSGYLLERQVGRQDSFHLHCCSAASGPHYAAVVGLSLQPWTLHNHQTVSHSREGQQMTIR